MSQEKHDLFYGALKEIVLYLDNLAKAEPGNKVVPGAEGLAKAASDEEPLKLLNTMRDNAQDDDQRRQVERFAKLLVPDQAQNFLTGG